jgi:hypothetical protein
MAAIKAPSKMPNTKHRATPTRNPSRSLRIIGLGLSASQIDPSAPEDDVSPLSPVCPVVVDPSPSPREKVYQNFAPIRRGYLGAQSTEIPYQEEASISCTE